MLLIDEIDKADIEFPNDLLLELDRMNFLSTRPGVRCRETKPIVIITSNNERNYRCFTAMFFHYISFRMRTRCVLAKCAFPGNNYLLVRRSEKFLQTPRHCIKKPPSTSEFLDWLKLDGRRFTSRIATRG